MNKFLQLTPGRITSILLRIVAILLIANLGSILIKFVLGKGYGFTQTFYFNGEANVPSFYSSLAILCSAMLLLAIGKLESEKQAKRVVFWKVLGYVFVFLAIDEFVSIHEGLSSFTRNILGTSNSNGYLYYAWFIPYCILFGLLLIILTKSFLQLPNRIKFLFITAGSIYVTGAVGMEMVGGKYELLYGTNNIGYALLATGEELLEMLGIILFIYTLSGYYVEHLPNHTLNLAIQLNNQVQLQSKVHNQVWQSVTIQEGVHTGSLEEGILQMKKSEL